MQFDFDEMKDLFISDPDLFSVRRKTMIKEALDKVPAASKDRILKIQAELDSVYEDESMDPGDKMLLLNSILTQSVENLEKASGVLLDTLKKS